jgi:predicted dehydrogenase
MAKEAIEAGKHVVCEKPLTLETGEALELIKLAKVHKKANAVYFNVRFYPLLHHAREMIARGDLGEIFAVNGSYQQDWLFFPTDYSWRLEHEYTGDSRAIADIGSHWFDTIKFITGKKVVRVCSDFATFHSTRKKPLKPVETYSGKVLEAKDYKDVPIDTEDYATVLLRFDNGAHGSLTVNQVAAGRKNRIYFEIYGSKASIAFDSERPNEMWIGRREGNNEIVMKDPSLLYPEAAEINSYPGGHNEGYADTFKQLTRKFYKYIAEKGYETDAKIQFPTFEAGLREMELCDAIVESARHEKWVVVKENEI